jgi:hypothetical protein
LSTTDQGEEWYDDEPVKGVWFQTILGAFLCALGMVAAELWHDGVLAKPALWLQWRPKYQWNWMVWMIPSAMLIFAVFRSIFSIPVHYAAHALTVTSSLTAFILYVCLNEGALWQDQSSKLQWWLAMGVVATIWNTMSINAIARSGGSRWVPLITLAQLGCVAALILQAYGSLGEWVLTGIGVCFGASVVSLVKGSSAKLFFGWQLSTIVVPLGIMAVSCLVVSRFFETPAVPNWLLGIVLGLPTVVGAIDLCIGRLTNPWTRAIIAAVACGLVLGAIVFLAIPVKQEW